MVQNELGVFIKNIFDLILHSKTSLTEKNTERRKKDTEYVKIYIF